MKITRKFLFPILVVILIVLTRMLPLNFITFGVIEYFINFLVILYAIWLVWGTTPFSKNVSSINNSLTNLTEQQVNTIFESSAFRTGLKNALPTTNGDEDKIWEMLRSMIILKEDKSKEFKKEYKKFFRWTIVVGVCLSIVFIVMSYLFLYEASTRAEKSVVKIESQISEIQESLRNVQRETIKDGIQENLAKSDLYKKRLEGKNAPVTKTIEEIKLAFNKINNENFQDLVAFNDFLKSKESSLTNEEVSAEFRNSLSQTISENQTLIDNRKKIFDTLPNSIQELNKTTKEANENFAKPENRIPETIKRIFITVGVIAFFLGILRYLARIYRENFIQSTVADQDHLLLKKFFIAYKFAKDDERKKILTTFLSVSNLPNVPKIEEEKEDESNKIVDLVKEIVGVFKEKS